MDTRKFRTRQEELRVTNPKGRDYIIGVDLGYSASKVFFETGAICFPSYAKRLENSSINIVDPKDILFRDESNGEIYLVGYNAQNMVEASDTNDTDAELYSRNRYTNHRFRIICKTALALAIQEKKDNRKIIIQTGLPSSYVGSDTVALKKALTEKGAFSLKVGKQPWKRYELCLDENDIYVMPQPMGALYSVLVRNDGTFMPNAIKLLTGNTLVLDAGFGTFDFYGIKERSVVCQDSVDEIGMRAVFTRTCKKIQADTNEDIRVAALQKYLASGRFDCINEEEMTAEERELAPYLEAANKEIFEEAKEKVKSITNAFRGYQHVIVDGGTGEAWFEWLKEWLAGMKTITLYPSNYNDHLPYIYSNARGYYMFRYMDNVRKK